MFTSSDSPPPPLLPPYKNETTTPTNINRRKRRPAGTPDPDAEVVSLSPRTLLESDRYVCEICNQGFQRDQNLQMHRRRHKVPWKLVKREPSSAATETRKRVFVCPEPSCLHHEPGHALGDLVGIKKHYRRKHSDRKQWVCARCSKGYAVQSDYKAHLKTCGTRGHSCDCGRVFSRVESFIEHQDACDASRSRSDRQTGCLSRLTTDTPFDLQIRRPIAAVRPLNLDLQLPPTLLTPNQTTTSPGSSASSDKADAIQLHLSLSLGDDASPSKDQLRITEAEKDLANEARKQAKEQAELAEKEFASAKNIRRQAQAELDRAFVLRDHAMKSINSILLQITCQACRHRLGSKPAAAVPPIEYAASYVSSTVTEEPKEV